MTPQDILARAHDIVGEYGIARGYQSLDGAGRPVPAGDSRAESFCSIGAITRACIDLGVSTWKNGDLFDQAVDTLREAIPARSIIAWNDNEATDEQIKLAFARAANLPVSEAPAPVHADQEVLALT